MKKKIIKLTESDLRNIVNESVRTILRESSKKLYHYCGIDQLKKMYETNKIFFYGGVDKEYSGGYYGFSTTRQRNSKMGFPAMSRHYGGGLNNSLYGSFLIRLELDGDVIQNLQYYSKNKLHGVKVKPFDYMWHENEDEEPRLNGKEMEMQGISDDYYDDEAQEQQYSQAEDRVLSKGKSVGGFRRCLVRIDAYFDMDNIGEDINEVTAAIETINYLLSLQRDGVKVYFYTNQDAFNIQANKTEPVGNIYGRLKDLEYLLDEEE